MNGIEEAIEKMVQDATADLRARVEALEAIADAVAVAAHGKRAAATEWHPSDAPAPKRVTKTTNGHGNGPHHWSAELRRAASRRMKKRNSDPAFRAAKEKGIARRWRQYRAQNGSVQ